ncbi:hypothetical protein KMI_08g13540 [Encephalitozoon hellem]|nr:hypothetical protein KMI_08g13540 [Encephalitozoon hellem]
MRISLKDEKFFRSMLGIFVSRGDITFGIRQGAMCAFSYGQSNFYLTMSDDVITIDGDDLTFTVRARHLLEGMDGLNKFDLVIEEEVRLIDGGNTIFIPFVTTIEEEYEEPDVSISKLIVSSESLEAFGILKGIVTYEVEDDKLFIRRAAADMLEEVEFFAVDFIVAGDMQFRCNNKWTEILTGIKGYIDRVMLTFSPDTLCAQFLFKRSSKSYLELRILRSLAE